MNYVFSFGKFKGQNIEDIPLLQLDDYLGWMEDVENPSQNIIQAIKIITEYLKQPEIEYRLECLIDDRDYH